MKKKYCFIINPETEFLEKIKNISSVLSDARIIYIIESNNLDFEKAKKISIECDCTLIYLDAQILDMERFTHTFLNTYSNHNNNIYKDQKEFYEKAKDCFKILAKILDHFTPRWRDRYAASNRILGKRNLWHYSSCTSDYIQSSMANIYDFPMEYLSMFEKLADVLIRIEKVARICASVLSEEEKIRLNTELSNLLFEKQIIEIENQDNWDTKIKAYIDQPDPIGEASKLDSFTEEYVPNHYHVSTILELESYSAHKLMREQDRFRKLIASIPNKSTQARLLFENLEKFLPKAKITANELVRLYLWTETTMSQKEFLDELVNCFPNLGIPTYNSMVRAKGDFDRKGITIIEFSNKVDMFLSQFHTNQDDQIENTASTNRIQP